MLKPLKTSADTSWFMQDRFGLFIHWGLYALPARHEWIKSFEKMSDEHYDRYFRYFEPDLYDPDCWAQAAADAGMKYFVVTTKHHDGFCLWDSKLTDFKSTQAPLCGRDLLRPMIKAFNERGLRTGFYHSLLDWHHPDYVVDYSNHPQRGQLPPRQPGSATVVADINKHRRHERYIEYLHGQVRELLSDFGQVDVLWFDFSWRDEAGNDDLTLTKGAEAWGSEKLLEMVRSLQPGIILTDRLDLPLPLSGGDMKTPERTQPREWVHVDVNGSKVPVVWEACQTFGSSWGYHRDEQSLRSTEQLIQTLIDCVSKGGNLLLNVGPDARGQIDPRALDRMQGIGRWMRLHSRSIYGCTQPPAHFTSPQDARITWHPQKKRLYIHLFAWPYSYLHLDGKAFCEQVAYAQFLHDGSEISMEMDPWHARQITTGQDTMTLTLPLVRPDVAVPVIELHLK